MEWNVIYYNFNRKKIMAYNIFSHGGFEEDVRSILNKRLERKDFDEALKRSLRYYFWAKCEWEIVISPWVGDENAAVKKDVFWQVMNNWPVFSDYVWSQSKRNRRSEQ